MNYQPMSAPMYTRFAKEYDKVITDNIYNAHLERPSLLSMLPDLKGKQVLDLGCGPGAYIDHLLEQGASVTALDISEQMIAIVNNKFAGKVRAYAQNLAEGLPQEKDNTFDLIICPLMVHYIEELQPFFAEICRVMKGGGEFVFSTHHPFLDLRSAENYFQREKIIETWDTIGQPVEVQFYRRSLTEFFSSLASAGLYVDELSEGKPAPEMQQICLDHYQRLSKKPHFIFLKCCKR